MGGAQYTSTNKDGAKVTASNIISIAMIIKIIFLRFNINPNIPIKNKKIDKFINFINKKSHKMTYTLGFKL